jgi:small-conductance mechanosensitive channel
MEHLMSLIALIRDWIPFLITLLIAILLVGALYRVLLRKRPPTGNVVSRQMLLGLVVSIFVVILILELPIDDAPRGQLMSLLGILVTAAVALSSTTLLGNAMAGFMLRSIRNFRPGDFIVVDGHRGRVSELGLLRTEIQTERRNLTTFPNLYLVSNPVSVVRSSGTFISATVSLGYDVPRDQVEKALLTAAEDAGLTDPFVFVMELGDFSITYLVAGFLEETKYLISAESELRACMLDSLHRSKIEIVSPTFMNQRQLKPEQIFIPKTNRVSKPKALAADETRPEEKMFDKAEIASHEAKAEEMLKAVIQEISELDKAEDGKADDESKQAHLETLQAKKAELEEEVRLRKEATKAAREEDAAEETEEGKTEAPDEAKPSEPKPDEPKAGESS